MEIGNESQKPKRINGKMGQRMFQHSMPKQSSSKKNKLHQEISFEDDS